MKQSRLIFLAALLIFVILLAGYYSRHFLLSAFYIYEAEEYNYKAGFILRNKRASIEERKRIYRKSCDYFSKAYEIRQASFSFNRCEYAVDSCLWVEDFESVKKFREVQQSFEDPGGYKEADSPIYLW